MDGSSGHFRSASNITSNAFVSWNKPPFEAQLGTTDITLQLNSPGGSTLFSSSSIGAKRKWADVDGPNSQQRAFLSLGLGLSSSSSENSKGSSATACTMSSAKETTDEESSMDLGLNFQLHLGNENTYIQKVRAAPTPKAMKIGPFSDLELSLSMGPSDCVTNIAPVSPRKHKSQETSMARSPSLNINLPSLHETSSGFIQHCNAYPVPATSDLNEPPKTPVASSSGITNSQRNSTTKTCQFQGCIKGARGASGLCIAHGGGRRCQRAGCHKGAEGRTVYCKAHGGGRRCQFLGCTKSAEGRTDYCIAHGGGRRCRHEGCVRAARGKSGLCIRHGGGKRCQMENCTKSAEGYSGLCISHGGGRRCQFPQCTKGAQGSTQFCKGHGGGKRCSFEGGGVCPKSVHGGTQFCVAHGGGKRCSVPECTKSARGRTDYCVRHGGGKRCKYEGCGKSAQGSTDFCKAHGGGKRCSWGQDDLGTGPPCDRFARGKIGLCAAHSALVQDRCVHGGGSLGPAVSEDPVAVAVEDEKLKGVAFEGDVFSKVGMHWATTEAKNFMHCEMVLEPQQVSLPEGRVHGGNLMAFLSNSVDFENASKQSSSSSYSGMHQWM